MSTNISRCSTCCSTNVYIFVYILIGAPIVPLNVMFLYTFHLVHVCVQTCKVFVPVLKIRFIQSKSSLITSICRITEI